MEPNTENTTPIIENVFNLNDVVQQPVHLFAISGIFEVPNYFLKYYWPELTCYHECVQEFPFNRDEPELSNSRTQFPVLVNTRLQSALLVTAKREVISYYALIWNLVFRNHLN